jgi:hypothetical protein
MNRVKLSITNSSGQTLCKIGTSISPPKGAEYTDREIAELLCELSRMLSAKQEVDEFLDSSWDDEEAAREAAAEAENQRIIAKWAWLFDGSHNERVPTVMLIESQETPLI